MKKNSLSPGSPAPDKVTSPTIKTELLSSLLSNTPHKANKIVLFICAADSQDCKVEKGLIHREVYPGLRESMREKGFTLHIVDLCWSLHEKTPEPAELVLHELNRQSETGYIVPVILLNQCLGAPLVPKTIEPADLEIAKQADKGHILSDYYALDNMAQPPCFRLRPPATLIPKFKSEDKEEQEKALDEWRGEVEKIIGVFLAAFTNELRDTYLTTLVEQEVHNTVLMSEVLAKRCIWLQRVTSSQPLQHPTTPADMESSRRLDALQSRLKRELSEGHIHRLVAPGADQDQTQYQDQVVSFTKKTLTAILESIVSQHQKMTLEKDGMVVSPSLVEEVWIQGYWARKTSQCSANRQQLLHSLSNRTSGGVVVLIGEQGWGKTTLVSRLSETSPRIMLCSANLSQSSATLESALYSLMLQLDLDYRPQHFSLECFAKDLPGALEKAAKEEPITVILDGLDQFREFGTVNDVSWLPKTVPEKVTLIVTVVENGSIYNLLKGHLGKTENFIQVPSLDMKEAEGMIMSAIAEYNHSLQPEVQQAVLASLKHSTNPLYIKVLSWQTSWCNEYDHKLKAEGNLNKQIETMFSDLELMLGKDKVEICLALLTAAKWGLLDSEMIDLLASNDIYHSSTTYLPWAGALLFWTRIHKEMKPFLRTCPTTSLITWKDNAFRTVAIDKYKSRISWAHSTIATYFKGELWKENELKSRALSQPTQMGTSYNTRKLEELPYAVFKSTGSCKEFLTDHNWILQKLCSTSLSQVLEDWKMCQGPDWLGEILSSTGLGYDGRQLYTHLNYVKSKLPKEWQDASTNPPITSLVLLNQVQPIDAKEEKHFDILLRLPENPNYVVTVNTEKEEISVWSIQECEKVRTLKGIPQPLSLQMINDYHCVVLCKRELRVYDLDNGVLLSKLKGVMNQKMPYYGLHGSDHLVALSRNRMYVNLMKISTGDLVTTFKAGEDRFLNSLLVSGDGRMLVCGDETQKPFPLLVWDLASRKLLYDLRIPGHDFITSLSAITHQGHYVSCIAKEVDEPSPNFIVVYDLQSGTLFKKWKPGVDCVAVDISSRHTCVVSGHVDGTILVWDLITGNCRWTLKGHTAPVRYLRLDASSCLSMDAKSTDIRLWDLATGEQRAVYSPPGKVTCCEVAHDGRLVTVAVESIPKPICLELRHNPTLQALDTNKQPYGKEDNTGKEFTVSEEVR